MHGAINAVSWNNLGRLHEVVPLWTPAHLWANRCHGHRRGHATRVGFEVTQRERYRKVARLHVRCLDQGFLATLGEGFLSLMYEAIDRTEGATLLVAEQGGQLQGFVTGGVGMGPIYRRMLWASWQCTPVVTRRSMCRNASP